MVRSSPSATGQRDTGPQGSLPHGWQLLGRQNSYSGSLSSIGPSARIPPMSSSYPARTGHGSMRSSNTSGVRGSGSRRLAGPSGLGQSPTMASRVGPSSQQAPTASLLASRGRSEEHTSELQSRGHLVCRLPREKKQQETPET